jgi:hypothetical protein
MSVRCSSILRRCASFSAESIVVAFALAVGLSQPATRVRAGAIQDDRTRQEGRFAGGMVARQRRTGCDSGLSGARDAGHDAHLDNSARTVRGSAVSSRALAGSIGSASTHERHPVPRAWRSAARPKIPPPLSLPLRDISSLNARLSSRTRCPEPRHPADASSMRRRP